jgi:crotonobetainyl-CoA:carnitine CoA-transferase CaiB-like acyl-CoA transferase
MMRAAQANKSSLSVDLKDSDLGDALAHFVQWADVVHLNMRPGTPQKLGIDFDSLLNVRPDLVYGHAPGWGSSGPSAFRQSLEPHQSGHVGCGYEVAGQFNEPLYTICNSDVGNGMLGAVGILIGLLARERTGNPQLIENSHMSSALAQVKHIVRTANGEVIGAARLDPMQTGFSALERLYETADGWVCIVAVSDDEIDALGRALDVDIRGDARYSTLDLRRQNDDLLAFTLSGRIRAKPTDEIMKSVKAVNAPVVVPKPYNNVNLMRDPEMRRTGRVAESAHPNFGLVREIAHMIRTPGLVRAEHRVAPPVGSHTLELLREAGYTDERIEMLIDRGSATVFDPARATMPTTA